MKEKKLTAASRNNKCHQALILASLNVGMHNTKSLRSLPRGALLLGISLCQLLKNKSLFQKNLEQLSATIQKKMMQKILKEQTSSEIKLGAISVSSLSDGLKELHGWGIINYETNVLPKSERLNKKYENKKGMKVTIQDNALENVIARISSKPKAL